MTSISKFSFTANQFAETNFLLATIAFILVLLALSIQIYFLLRESHRPDPISHYILSISFFLLVFIIIQRSLFIQYFSVTNTFEVLLIFSAIILFILIFYRLKRQESAEAFIVFGANLLVMILLALASSPLFPKTILPLIPALRSSWLVWHVIMAIIGEAFFAVGFIASICYLNATENKRKAEIDRLAYITNTIGFLFYTLGGIIFGAIWAHYAWGRFWGWDPKETWALITAVIYAIYLTLRLTNLIRSKIAAILSITGFLLALFAFFGVNYFLSGLHGYN